MMLNDFFYLNTVNLITINFNLYKQDLKKLKSENREKKEILFYIGAVCV